MMTAERSTTSAAIRQGSSALVRLGRRGYAAKGMVYVVTGFLATEAALGIGGRLLVRAGWTYDPWKVGGVSQSLDALARQPQGRILFGAVALRLIAFGIFERDTA